MKDDGMCINCNASIKFLSMYVGDDLLYIDHFILAFSNKFLCQITINNTSIEVGLLWHVCHVYSAWSSIIQVRNSV
jgi:hypothetical protein